MKNSRKGGEPTGVPQALRVKRTGAFYHVANPEHMLTLEECALAGWHFAEGQTHSVLLLFSSNLINLGLVS